MPSLEDFPQQTEALLATANRVSQRNWCPATGGNFSLQLNQNLRLITRSGRDKSRLGIKDLLLCDADGHPLQAEAKASDETALHMRIYALDNAAGCVLHSHSVYATVLSRCLANATLRIQGFEMQKALGQGNPEDPLIVRILDNNQNIAELADELEQAWRDGDILCPGFLVRGHGLYAWGQDSTSAWRHLEAFEFLLECAWQERLADRSR